MDVDLERHLIHLPRNKAGNADARAFITRDLDEMIRAQFPDGLPTGPLITKDVPTSIPEISRQFRKIATRAAVPGNGKPRDGKQACTLHDLRRNYGSRWAVKVPAQQLMAMMRHSTINVSLDYYAETEQGTIDMLWGDE
ncbi:hypothetical protein Pan216_12880 [Planctomycetes bacterium Pan216]|uniref:Phage integrase family protein n=1 Tax=Kolteria novifilia TaxID=2527975 RepID=A0A518B0D8_9BACT|nr:hypothetical protein Pan216_12880 [Planctomycetes bacterium Pan216]